MFQHNVKPYTKPEPFKFDEQPIDIQAARTEKHLRQAMDPRGVKVRPSICGQEEWYDKNGRMVVTPAPRDPEEHMDLDLLRRVLTAFWYMGWLGKVAIAAAAFTVYAHFVAKLF